MCRCMPYQSCWLDKISGRIPPYSIGSMSLEKIVCHGGSPYFYLMTSSRHVHTYHLHTCFLILVSVFAELILGSFIWNVCTYM